jgi:DNA adenine methylase
MDPPYQGVCGNRDSRYYEKVDFKDFVSELEKLVESDILFILSYDGRKGEKTYGKSIPQELGLYRIEINAGRSSQSTLLGGNDVTYESLYISPELTQKLEIHTYHRTNKLQTRTKQVLLSI